MAGVFRTEDGLTFLGVIAFAVSLVLFLLALIYALRAILGLPALKSDGKTLFIYLIPFRRIPLLAIDHIVLRSDDVEIYDQSNKKLKINTRLARDPEEFFRGTGLLES